MLLQTELQSIITPSLGTDSIFALLSQVCVSQVLLSKYGLDQGKFALLFMQFCAACVEQILKGQPPHVAVGNNTYSHVSSAPDLCNRNVLLEKVRALVNMRMGASLPQLQFTMSQALVKIVSD